MALNHGILKRVQNECVKALMEDLPFGNELTSMKFGLLNDQGQEWRKEHPCSFPGCTNLSIIASHSITRRAILKPLSESGKLVTPQKAPFYPHTDTVGVVGLQAASTFPGLCNLHEQWYSKFETNLNPRDQDFIIAQNVRIILGNITWKAHQLEQLQQAREDVKSAWSRRIRKCMISKGIVSDSDEGTINEILILIWKIKEEEEVHSGLPGLTWKSYVEHEILWIKHCKNRIVELMSHCDQESKPGLTTRHYALPGYLPVAMGGVAPFRFGKQNDFPVILSVLPVGKETHILMGCFDENATELQRYWCEVVGSWQTVVSAVESWMIYGTGKWFMRPSVWDRLGTELKRLIVAELHGNVRGITHKFPTPFLEGTLLR